MARKLHSRPDWAKLKQKYFPAHQNGKFPLQAFKTGYLSDDEDSAGEDDRFLSSHRAKPSCGARRRFALRLVVSRTFGIIIGILLLASLIYARLSRETWPKSVDPSPFRTISWVPRDPPRKALILASFKEQDVSWTRNVSTDWEVFRYFNNDKSQKYVVPTKKGNEAAAYLTFIIEHYDELPDYMIFLHGHDRNWHQVEHVADKIRAANLTALREHGFYNLRCTHLPGCTEDSVFHVAHEDPDDGRWTKKALPGFIEYMFPELPLPEVLSSQCCAQFLVTKGNILGRSRDWWTAYREPLLGNLEKWSRNQWHSSEIVTGYKAGVLWEKCWHLAFGMDPIYCPSENYCRKTLFSDEIHCDGHTGRFQTSKGWENITCTTTFDDDVDNLFGTTLT